MNKMYSPARSWWDPVSMNNKQPITKAAKALKNKSQTRKPSQKPKTSNANLGLKSVPVARQRVRRMPQPKFVRSSHNGDVTVEHEEFIADIPGSVAFSNQGIPVNPGLISTFPWLAQMAPLYESYQMEALKFRFESTSGSTATGSVMLAMEYDATDPPATVKQQLSNYRSYVRSAPWEECECISLAEDLKKRSSYFVRSGALNSSQNINLFDVGTLNVATQGQANTAPIGELYVKYRVRFQTPQLLISGLGLSQSGKIAATSAGGAPVLTGNLPVVLSGTGAGITMTSTAPYQGLFSADVVGTALTDVAPGGTAIQTTVSDFLNAAATQGNLTVAVNFTGPGQTFFVGTSSGTITDLEVRVGQYAYSLA